MGIVRGPHGGEWGDFFHRSGAMTPGATERLMATYLTWRGIPLPRSLEPLARRAQQPHVPRPRLGTYGNAAVARMMAGGARHHSSSSSSRRTATITILLPRSRATTATRATNVRALAPSDVGALQGPMASTSSGPTTFAPQAPVTTPHQQHAADATRTWDALAPSRAGTPQSPRQERASKRAPKRHPPQHHVATGIQGHRASPAGSRAGPAPQIRGWWAPDPSNPLAPHTRTLIRPRNPKHHPARPHTVTSWQPAGHRRHRPTRNPAHAMAHLTGRRRAQETRRPRTPPRRHVTLPQPTPPPKEGPYQDRPPLCPFRL